jgi:hypothetical protein
VLCYCQERCPCNVEAMGYAQARMCYANVRRGVLVMWKLWAMLRQDGLCYCQERFPCKVEARGYAQARMCYANVRRGVPVMWKLRAMLWPGMSGKVILKRFNVQPL